MLVTTKTGAVRARIVVASMKKSLALERVVEEMGMIGSLCWGVYRQGSDLVLVCELSRGARNDWVADNLGCDNC